MEHLISEPKNHENEVPNPLKSSKKALQKNKQKTMQNKIDF